MQATSSLNDIEGFLDRIDKNPDADYVVHERLEPKFPIHRHRKGQLTYVEGGMTYIHTSHEIYFLPARHYVWIPAHLDHFVEHRSHAYMVRNVYFHRDEGHDHPFFSQMGIYPISNLLLEMLYFTEKWQGEVLPGDDRSQFLKTIKLLLPQVSLHPLPVVLPTTNHQRLEPVIQYIHQNMEAPLTLPQIAEEFGFSVRSLSRLFQQKLGISFLQYLKLFRIIKGMEALLQTDKSISEIAFEVGYNSLSAFSNTFYQLLHVRPAEFRHMR